MTIASRLQHIRQTISHLAKKYKRAKSSIRIIAVSKTRTTQECEQAYLAEQIEFAENYLQEAIPKIKYFQNKELIWHFIGNVQSNKAKLVAKYFDWVHTIDCVKIAELLNKHSFNLDKKLNVCIQINISNESTKSGISLAQLPALAQQISSLKNLQLRGLMTIAQQGSTEQQQWQFKQLRTALNQLNCSGHQLDTLSMGMSNDYQTAIAEGATMVRIGTGIFGPR